MHYLVLFQEGGQAEMQQEDPGSAERYGSPMGQWWVIDDCPEDLPKQLWRLNLCLKKKINKIMNQN
jgi:hypothetical protein